MVLAQQVGLQRDLAGECEQGAVLPTPSRPEVPDEDVAEHRHPEHVGRVGVVGELGLCTHENDDFVQCC